jgi:hypothetical protein
MSAQSRPGQTRPTVIAARAVVLAACGLLAAACGSVAAGQAASNQANGQPATHGPSAPLSAQPSTSPAGSPAPAAQVKLSITLAGAKHWSLQCEPASGNVADPQAVCKRLLGQPSLFAPSPHHVMCPQVMTDAPSFLVTGTYRGPHVHETIVAGGCDLGKWNTLHAIFQPGPQGGVNPGGPMVG